jgi:hypothetical protein
MKHVTPYSIFEARGLSPVSQETVDKIFARMNKGDEDYHEAVKAVWPTIPFSDKALIYNPAYTWVDAEDLKKLKAMSRFSNIKSMI